ncbi:heme-binding protein [Gemmobacter straminiformis]|uniref:Heme-binding protein n=2 Tax=Paragemmobacter straminiformis TaxID=2045119 RepID=A0A842I4P4_9RHOB|nr:heme-binding protein [Gemmobacter straminiformis]
MAEEHRHKGYEMPPYTVESVTDGVELRRYGAHVVAEVTVEGDRSAAIGRGFRALAGYIFGGNAEGEKIAMTVPVEQTPAAAGGWTVRFTMPAAYGVDDLPRPRDARVRLVQVAPDRQAVVTFTGLPVTADLETRAAKLRDWIAARGMTITAGPHFQFYDAPMTLPWKRRNEVAFTVE